MRPVDAVEFGPEQEALFRRARRLEIFSLLYTGSAAVFLFLVMGSSQAMRTSFLDNVIGLVPPLAFLMTSAVVFRPATPKFPYGFHAFVSIGYFAASLSLLALGVFLLVDGAAALVGGERPEIGSVRIFGVSIWAGWPMLAALAYAAVPAFFLGRLKLSLAPTIHDKPLYADAEMMKADWRAETAAAVGVVGASFGLWWADPGAAMLVSLGIIKDGASNTWAAVTDLIDETPKETVTGQPERLPRQVAQMLESLDWVEKAEVRMREEGHVFFGEAFVVPRTTEDIVRRIAEATELAKALNWRVHDLVIMPVATIDEDEKPG